MKKLFFLPIFALLTLSSCIGGRTSSTKELTSISIVDRNGFSETISIEERLRQYEQVNFVSNLPYQKVVRVFKRGGQGDLKSIITSYYTNGQIKQYLDVLNGRANGLYKEWHSNGTLKLEANIIGGTADIEASGDSGWLFDGIARAWYDDGVLSAEIPYQKGALEGISKYYHPSGKIWKIISQTKNKVNGKAEVYTDEGQLLSTTEYLDDVKHGPSLRYWAKNSVAARENYTQGFLASGQYFDINGTIASEIINGEGKRAVFAKDYILELHDFKGGQPNGEVVVLTPTKRVIRRYFVVDDTKDGEEIIYYENTATPLPKVSVEWHEGVINGLVKTWYPNGTQESQKEIHENVKNGLSTAWYYDGSLMFIEEYQKNKLIKGSYYKKGDKTPVSKVENGMGIATLYDSQGNYRNKVIYLNGKPRDDD